MEAQALAEPGTPPAGARWRAAAWIAGYLCLAAALHFFFTSIPSDADTEYHVAVGRLIREHGILHAFPWTPFSWLADHYADKELLFHLLLAPLSGLDWVLAAKIVGTVASASVLAVLYLVLAAERVPLAGLWALLPLAAAPAFVYRWLLVRPHVFSVALALAVLWAAARGRLALLAVLSAVYPWAYVAWQMPLAMVGIAEVARLGSGERLRWRPWAAAAGGIAAGLALHPNAANLLRLTWIQLVEVLLRKAWGARVHLELGSEFRSFTAGEWLRLLLPAALLAVAAVVLAWRDRRRGSLPLAFAVASLAFGVLTARTARFAEYMVPFAAAAFALAARAIPWRPLAATVLGACALVTGAETGRLLEGLRTHPERLPAEIAAQMEARIPRGARVFTCQWGYTGTLMLALPERSFMVALDPTFFAVKDPMLYDLWFRLPLEPVPEPARMIRESFGARYVACYWEDRLRPFFDRIAFEPGVRTIVMSDAWNVYDLGEFAGAGGR